MSDNGFQLVSYPKRRKRDEVDQQLNISDKRPRTFSYKLRESSGATPSTRPCDTQATNRFEVLSGTHDAEDSVEKTQHTEPDIKYKLDSNSGGVSDSDEDVSWILAFLLQQKKSVQKTGKSRMKKSSKPIPMASNSSISSNSLARPLPLATSSSASSNSLVARNDGITAITDTVDEAVEIALPVAEITKRKKPRNPIYLFYEAVESNPRIKEHTEGNKYFRCYHTGLLQTVTKLMRGSTTGLESHLRQKAPLMYQLFQALRNRNSPPTDEEIAIANKSKPLSTAKLQELLSEYRSENIISASAHQEMVKLDPWDQAAFERQLTEWIVEDDLPFSTVDSPQFRSVIKLASRNPMLKIPSSDTVKRIVKELEQESFTRQRRFLRRLDSA